MNVLFLCAVNIVVVLFIFNVDVEGKKLLTRLRSDGNNDDQTIEVDTDKLEDEQYQGGEARSSTSTLG